MSCIYNSQAICHSIDRSVVINIACHIYIRACCHHITDHTLSASCADRHHLDLPVKFSINSHIRNSRLKYESGVHRVQRVPETESQGRIHTSTVTVAVLVEADEVAVDINPTDLRIDVFRASGAGGQHINKTESAVRITHIPTGLVVECQDERSQYKNKDKAMKILRSRLYEQMLQEQNDKIASERRMQVGTGDRSERIRTYNFPQGRMTDHRIGLTLYRLEDIMNGNLDEVFDALATADELARLAGQQGEA